MLTPAHVDLYCRIKSSPFSNAGYTTESAIIYCDLIERRLSKLDDATCEFMLLAAMGYTHQEIAALMHVSLRTLARRRAKLYGH